MGGEQMGRSLVRAKVLPKQTGKWMKKWWKAAGSCRTINLVLKLKTHKTHIKTMNPECCSLPYLARVAATRCRGRGLMSN